MRYVVFSDVHNQHEYIDKLPRCFDEYLCLGDIIDKGAERTMRTIDKIQALGAICVHGSHDMAVIEDSAMREWRFARRLHLSRGNVKSAERLRKQCDNALYLRETLPREYIDFIKNMPITYEITDNKTKILMVHDTVAIPRDINEKWSNRIDDKAIAEDAFDAFQKSVRILLVGHTHIPIIYNQYDDKVCDDLFKKNKKIELSKGRFIINPGTLGGGVHYIRDDRFEIFKRRKIKTYGILDTDKNTYECVFI